MAYEARWNNQSSIVEHTFTATENQIFTVKNVFTNEQTKLKVFCGEEYVLSNSIKPSAEDMKTMIEKAGWEHLHSKEDSDKQFHIHLAKYHIAGSSVRG